ncbi:ATP-binding cassette domain-containing protein [Marinomonas ostreistagni]|uniref:ATP-binding cassette domain-containing protein n=1 Tax=Marinomonas ostreistagni TaxID=359209 RepID=UPI00194ECC53|nr:ATP-binding cassette domain-containing protein [Marinomonas ostreistagni]MBM6549778.1 ABC transporter ATP-binding protein [Marinomonas ostreistagni]
MLTLSNYSLTLHTYAGFLRRVETPRLSELNLTVHPGELVAIIGGSGAGKSLLAHSIMGLLPNNAKQYGQIAFKGHALSGAYPAGVRGRQIALMPQEIGHLDPLAKVGAQIRWAGRRVGLTDVDPAACLAQVGLSKAVADLYPSALSGGMARRVLMALAVLGKPDLLIADEPTVGLDSANREQILQLLRGQAQAQRAALVITHDLSAVLPLADRVVMLDEGRLVGVEHAHAFLEEGEGLQSHHARALWQALPQNGFC